MFHFVVTVDVDPPIPQSYGSLFIEYGVENFLKLFDEHLIKATFFVPAVVAEKFPTTIKKVVKKGHEVACHGLKHDKREATLGVSKQLQIIKTATEIIQSVTGSRPFGFRAPLFNVNRNCWAALQKNDYAYDSSIVCSPFYGKYKNPFSMKPFPLLFSKEDKNHSLLEVPVSVNPFLPFPLGGAYFRIFGTRWCKLGMKINFIHGNPVVFYIHPKDVIPRQWGLSWWWYQKTSNCMKMFKKIIEYARLCGAKFVTAYEVAKLFEVDQKRR
ncbi:MAG: polysaccharide deacetylase family protein [Candidatus Bathyarchaeia archaeon]